MSSDKVVSEKLDGFNKLIIDLKNVVVQINDEDQAFFVTVCLAKDA